MQETMSATTPEFLRWVASRPRSYREAMEAWRTSCPRLSPWEDALGAGLIAIEPGMRLAECRVVLTARGRAVIDDVGEFN